MRHIQEGMRNLVPLGFLVLFVVPLFFSSFILSGKPLWGSDFVTQFYPWKKFIYDHIWHQGSLPLWNPYLFSGTPIIANIQASMFYPLGFLYYLLPPVLAYGYSTMLHCALGSVLMYLFMHQALGISKVGALISALIFSFNGYFMAHLYAGHLSFVQSYIWIPLIFHLLYRFTETFDCRYAVATGLVLGIQILGGFPQITFYTVLAALLFAVYQGSILLRTRAFSKAMKLAIGFAMVLGVGFCLAAVQMLPTLEFSGLSTRAGGINYAFATYDSLHPRDLLAFLIPDIFGNPIDHSYWPSQDSWHFWETCSYVGMLPLILVFISAKASSLRTVRVFFILLIGLSLLLALGKYNPIYPVIHKLPGFDRFRIPAQIIFLYVFGIAVLSGMGFDTIKKSSWRLNRVMIVFLVLAGCLLMVFFVGIHSFSFEFYPKLFNTLSTEPVAHTNQDIAYERIRHSINRSALLLFCGALFIVLQTIRRFPRMVLIMAAPSIIIVDLYLFGAQFIRSYEWTNLSQQETIAEQLTRNPTQGRVILKGELFMPNDATLYGFPSILGYDPLILRRYVYFIETSQNQPHDDHVVNLTANLHNPNAKLLELLNAKKFVLDDRVLDLRIHGSYLNFVNKPIIKSHDDVLPFMESDDFDPKTMVVFEPGEDEQLMTVEPISPVSASCAVFGYDNEIIRIRTSSNQKGFLVLSEIFYPGWKATVDRKKVEILKGNYLFRVIPLEKGYHDVHLYFVSWPLRIGVVITLITLTLSIWFILKRENLFKHLVI
jgi:hypothetical protein